MKKYLYRLIILIVITTPALFPYDYEMWSENNFFFRAAYTMYKYFFAITLVTIVGTTVKEIKQSYNRRKNNNK